ncbi:MAG: type IX secretion system membrane protein PorP/SprF [Bacteroidetes bacterium]|nr:type IX secretion system membrane protein PorP/SprF [Bacteroidota bacterium]
MMKTHYIRINCLIIFFLFISTAVAQQTLTDNDINFKRVSYNTSLIHSDSSQLMLNFTTSLGGDVQETSRMHFMAYGNIKKVGIGIGAKVNSRFKDIYKTTSAEILLSKNIKFKEKNDFNFGLNFGVLYNSISDKYFNEYVELEDVTISQQENKVRFIGGFGVSYIWNNSLEFGFSMPELVKSNNEFYPTFFGNVAYKQRFGEQKALYIEPTLLIYSTDLTGATIEGALKAGYHEYVWAKIGGRNTKTMLFGLGGGYNFINVGYVMNMNFGDYSNIQQMQHNINLSLNFLQVSNKKKTEKEKEIVIEEN